MNYMDIREFTREGYLQEINRQFLHPLGLALVVEVSDEGEERITGVWDARDDPEGISFSNGVLDPDKANRVMQQQNTRLATRQKALGFFIQGV